MAKRTGMFIESGIQEYTITDAKIVTGELEKSICTNSIILARKIDL